MSRPERAERRLGAATPAAEAPEAAAWPPGYVKWSPIWAGFVVTIAIQTMLTVLGLAVGLGQVGVRATTATTIWAGISVLIALFIGGYVSARFMPFADNRTGAWYGFVLWSLFVTFALAVSITGAAGAFGLLSTAITPRAAATGGAAAVVALLMALVVAVVGGWAGGTRRMRA